MVFTKRPFRNAKTRRPLDPVSSGRRVSRGQRPEARGQRPEARGQRPEARGQRPEARGQR
ncbi:MAG: penicillin-binding protein, partial [Gammaproteobacteria bacterium]|nr:penicillin-binding protein [Gammaproteobacteria bacterium]